MFFWHFCLGEQIRPSDITIKNLTFLNSHSLIWGSLCELPSSWPQARVEGRVRGAPASPISPESPESLEMPDEFPESSRRPRVACKKYHSGNKNPENGNPKRQTVEKKVTFETHVMSCYLMICYVICFMLWYVMSCYLTLMLCNVMWLCK